MGNTEHLRRKAEQIKIVAKEAAKSKVKYLVQKKSEEIPVYPYGYKQGKRVPDWVVTPEGVDRDAFIKKYLSHDFLPATATKEQFENLYGQLHQHAFPIAAHILECSREYIISPEIVCNGKTIPEVKNTGTPVTSFIDKDLKHSYHFIRVFDSSKGDRFIDFLRENATGYVLAWRVFATLAQAGTAKLCYFKDEPDISLNLAKLFTFERTEQRSDYSVVKHVKFGKDSMVIGVDRLAIVHASPTVEEDPKTVLSVHFFLLVFGEAPRSDIFKRRMYETIFSETEKTTKPIGDLYQVCANNWNYSSKTICLLRLLIRESEFAANLKENRRNKIKPEEPHTSILEFLEEMKIHKRVAQERCRWIAGQDIQDLYKLSEQEVDGEFIYEKDAYKRLAVDCISLLKFSKLVLAVIAREIPYDKPLFLDEFSSKESEKPHVDESDFFKRFESFEDANRQKPSNLMLMKFLPHLILFLERWEYTTRERYAMSIEEIKTWCREFVTRKRSGKSEVAAANGVIKDWMVERGGLKNARGLVDALKDLMKFITTNPVKKAVVVVKGSKVS